MLYLLNTEELDDDFIEEIKKAEKKYFYSEKSVSRNRLSLCGRALLAYVLKRDFGIDAFSYRYSKNGKPYLKNEKLFFSISHSGDYVLCCVCEKEVGCDIEKIKDYNPKVAARFFTAREAELLENNENEDFFFAKLWTLKESILKKDGTGISGGLDTYCFSDYVAEESFSAYGCHFYSFSFGEYMASVCSENSEIKTEFVSDEKIVGFIGSLI